MNYDPYSSKTTKFTNQYKNKFEQMKYFFFVGQDSHEVFLILFSLWIICFISYFLILDVIEGEEDSHID
jgi:hypothetical protein